jgi:putative solute:sodium symporter small subunit
MNQNQNRKQAYWRANTNLIRNLLILWAVVSLGLSILFVQPLNSFKLGGVPFGFWVAQQGSIYIFVALIFFYANQMDKIDRFYVNRTQVEQEQATTSQESSSVTHHS